MLIMDSFKTLWTTKATVRLNCSSCRREGFEIGSRFRWLAGVLLALVMFCGRVHAQSRSPVAEFSDARRVYVPMEEIQVVMERDKQGVLLPKVRFDAMLAQAKANSEKFPAPNGVAVVVTNADYVGRVAGDQLLISVTVELTQFEDCWHETRFGLQRLALEQALLDGAAALVGRNSDGTVSLLSESRGRHTLTLQLSTELTAQGSDQITAFSLLRAPSGTFSISLPAGKRLLLGNLNLVRPKPSDQVADYKIAVGGLGGLQLRITDRAAENAADSMTFANTGYGLKVAPGEVTWHALSTLQVFGKPVDRMTFSVPSQLEIAEVEAPGLERWDLSDDPNEPQRTMISLTFGQAFDGMRKISFKGVMATEAEKPWSVPPLRITNVISHIGQVVIQYAAGVRLRVEETSGVRRAAVEQKAAADMPDDVAIVNATETLRFDIWQPEFVLRLVTQPKQREVQTALAAVLDVNVTGLDLEAAITVETHFAPLFELDIRFPVEWQVLSVKRDDQPLLWQIVGLDQPGVNHLRILLNPSIATDASGQIRLALRRDVDGWPVESEPITVNLPELFLPQSSLNEGAIVIRGDDDLELSAFDLTGLDPQPLKADYERLRFQSQDTHYAGKLKITRKASRVSVQTMTVGRIDPQTVHAFMQALVEVQGGGIRTLQVALPESAGASIRFECSGRQIVEQKPVKVANGERFWNLQFDRRLRGQAVIVTDMELPRGDASEYQLPQPRFVDAERQNGYFAIEASGEQRLVATAVDSEGAALSETDPLDLPQMFYRPKERIVAVYRSLSPGAVLKLKEEKFEKLPIPTAICPSMEISTILGRTGELQHQAVFQLDLVGVQGLHVTFPADTTLWATLVDGQPVEVRRNGDVYLIPLTKDGAVSQPSTEVGPGLKLQLYYRTAVRPVSQFGTINQEPPTLTVESGQRFALPVEVLSQKWHLFYPSDVQIVESQGALEPELKFDRTGTLANLVSNLRFPPMGELIIHLLVVVAFVVVYMVLKRGFRPSALMIMQFGLVVLLLGIFIPTMWMISSRERSTAVTGGTTSSYVLEEEATESKTPPPPAAQPMPAAAKGLPDLANLKFHAEGDMDQPEAQPPRKDGGRSGEVQSTDLGLLSLQIGFDPPAGSRQRTYHYEGAETGIPLDLSYVDRSSRNQVRFFMMALFGLIAWFLKQADLRTKAKLATLGIAIPFILLPFVPAAGQNLIDGSFFGTLVGILIWLVCGLVCRLRIECCPSGMFGRKATVVSSGLLFAMLLANSERSFAEDKGKPVAPATPQEPATAAASEPQPVIIPFEIGTEPLASDRVFLSHEQFLRLYQLANPEKGYKQPPPKEGGLIEALYAAKLVPDAKNPSESVVEVTARYAARNLVDGQLIVDLPIGQISVSSAKLDGQSAPLIVGANGLSVAVSKPGLHVIDLKFAIPARLSGSTGAVLLPLKQVPAGKLSFELPGKDLSIRINGSTTIYRRLTQANVQTVEIPVDQGGDIAIAWQPQQSQNATAAVVHVDSVEAFTLTDAGAAISHGFAYQIRQGGVSDVSFSMPDSLKLQAVNGPDVGGWELQGEPGHRKLRVIFRRNVSDQTRLTIETFFDVKVTNETTLISVPQIAPLEVTTEIGQLAVFSGNQFSIRAEQSESLIQVDGDKFATQVPISRPKTHPELAYRFSKRPFVLSLRAQRLESQAHVTAQQASFISLHKQNITTRLRYNLTGAPRSSVSVQLPDAFVLLDVQATGLRDWYLSKQDEVSLLTVELNSRKIGEIEVIVSGFTPCQPAVVSVKFPHPTDVTRLESSSAIWLDEGLTATIGESAGWRSVDAAHVSPELRSVRPNQSAQFSFTSTSTTPSPITMNVSQSSARLSANGLSVVTVTDVAVIYTLALQWKIDAAKTDALTVTTPDWLAGKLEFSGQGVRDTVQSDAGNKRTRWTVNLRSPVSGKYFLVATATLPPATNLVQAPSLVFENDKKPVEAQRQYVLLINSSLSQLTSVDPSLIESVQREDVPLVIQQDLVDQATELDRVKTPLNAPEWSVHRFAHQQSAPASVNVADMTTVLSRDGTYRAEGIFTIKNHSRQFLALKMPEATELLSVFVAGQPSRAVIAKLPSQNGATVQLIALPKTSAASLSFPVKIVWRGKLKNGLPKASNLRSREYDIPAPQILSQQQDSDFGIPVARTRWTVYLPDDLDVQASRSTARHNLSLSDESEQLYGKALLQEASELVGYLDQFNDGEAGNNSSSRMSSRQKGEATNNLKQLGLILQDYEYRGADQNEFNKNKQDVMRRLSEIEKKAAADQAHQANAFGNLLGEDVLANREIAENQKRSLVDNNGDGISKAEKWDDDKFNFMLATKPNDERKNVKGKEGGKDNVDQNAAGQNRAQLRSSNEVNFSKLNSVISNNSLSRVQSQSATDQKSGAQLQQQGQLPSVTITIPNNSSLPDVTFQNSDSPAVFFNSQPINDNVGNFWRSQLSLNGSQSSEERYDRAPVLDPSMSNNGVAPLNKYDNNLSPIPRFGSTIKPGKPSSAGGMGGGGMGGLGSGNNKPAAQSAGPKFIENDVNLGRKKVKRTFGIEPMTPAGRPGADNQQDMAKKERAKQGNDAEQAWDEAQMMAQGQAPRGGVDVTGGQPWKQAGGLSLDIELPKSGRKLVFTKTGGDPKLALMIRSRQTDHSGVKYLWSVLWLLIAGLTYWTLQKPEGLKTLLNQLPTAAMAFGLFGFFFVAAPLSYLSLALFLIGALTMVIQSDRTEVTA